MHEPERGGPPHEGPDAVIVANRLPVEFDAPEGWRRAPGGLVSAKESVLREAEAIWVGWSGQFGDQAGALDERPGRALTETSAGRRTAIADSSVMASPANRTRRPGSVAMSAPRAGPLSSMARFRVHDPVEMVGVLTLLTDIRVGAGSHPPPTRRPHPPARPGGSRPS